MFIIRSPFDCSVFILINECFGQTIFVYLLHLAINQFSEQTNHMGPFKCYVTQMGVWDVKFSGKKCYEGIRFTVISITRGVGGGPISRKR